jgi:hypothetical protein
LVIKSYQDFCDKFSRDEDARILSALPDVAQAYSRQGENHKAMEVIEQFRACVAQSELSRSDLNRWEHYPKMIKYVHCF